MLLKKQNIYDFILVSFALSKNSVTATVTVEPFFGTCVLIFICGSE